MLGSGCRFQGSGEVPRGEKIHSSGTDPESFITDYTLVYEDESSFVFGVRGLQPAEDGGEYCQ